MKDEKTMTVTLNERFSWSDLYSIEVVHGTKKFHEFIMRTIFSNQVDDSWYILKNNLKVNPFFQSGCNFEQSNGYMLIEFWTDNFDDVCSFFNEFVRAWDEQLGTEECFYVVYNC